MCVYIIFSLSIHLLMDSKISQRKKIKYCMMSLICGILKIIQMKVYSKTERLTDIENKLVVITGEREGGQGRGMGLKDINYYV